MEKSEAVKILVELARPAIDWTSTRCSTSVAYTFAGGAVADLVMACESILDIEAILEPMAARAIRGDEDARVFCHRLGALRSACLVSIACTPEEVQALTEDAAERCGLGVGR